MSLMNHGFGVYVRGGRHAVQREPLCVELDRVYAEEVVHAQGQGMPAGVEDLVRPQGGLSDGRRPAL